MGVFPAEPRGLYREAKVDEGGGELPNGCHHHHCHQSSSSPPSVIAIAIVVTVAIAIGHGRRCCTRQASRQAGWQAGVQSAGQEGKNAGPRAIWNASKQAGRPRSVDICSLDPPQGAHHNCSQRAHVMWLCCRRRSVSPMPQRPASVPLPLFANATACSSCACACASCATAQAIGNASAEPCASSEQRNARVDTSWYLCDDDASDVCGKSESKCQCQCPDGSVLRALHDRHRHHRRCQAPPKSVVYVTRKGRRFHNSYGCSGALLPLDVLTAHDQGYTQCKKWCCRCRCPE